MKHIVPVSQNKCIETFTFAEHVKYKKDNNLTDYSGGSDWAPFSEYRSNDIPIHPSAPLKIIYAGWNDKARKTFGYGVCVRGDCGDGDIVVLGHLQDGSLGFEVGKTVSPADTIGLMSWTGNVRPQGERGKHVHWGVKRNGVYINPMKQLGDQMPVTDPVTPPVNLNLLPAGLVKVINDDLRLRSDAGIGFFISGLLKAGAVLEIEAEYREVSNYIWRKLAGQILYIAEINLSTGERYLEKM